MTSAFVPKRVHQPLSLARQETFLRELALHGVWSRAARAASPHSAYGASRSFRSLAERDPAFQAKAQAAQEEADASILSEIRRRAIEGIERPVFQKGQRVFDEFEKRPATTREFSDQLLLALARSRFKDFQDRKQVEVTGEIAHTHQRALQINPDWFLVLSHDQRQALRDILVTIAQHRGEPIELIDQAAPSLKYIDVEAEAIEPWEISHEQ